MGKINSKKEDWILDQIAKSKFFHIKLHEWELVEVLSEIESIKGENFDWNDKKILGISIKAWNKIIHQGIKPVKVFCHPEIIINNPKLVRYYRMLAMVSQKSMQNIGLNVNDYEEGNKKLDYKTAQKLANHLNRIISLLIEQDIQINEQEFNIWRGMTAGTQAQGAWQNVKGNRAEVLIRELIKEKLRRKNLIQKIQKEGNKETIFLTDGRKLIMSKDPDIAIYDKNNIKISIEIKGGIDTAGVLERIGASLKSFKRIKSQNPNTLTILILSKSSITAKAIEEIKRNKNLINLIFYLEDILNDFSSQNKFLSTLGFV